jgi:serine/threonine protein kinase
MLNKIGRFEILRKLDESKQNAVYLARDSHMGREVMIKLLSHCDQHLNTLLPQVRIASKLQHKNIVTLLDASEHDGAPYLVYAFVNGISLSQQLKSPPSFTTTQAAQMITDVLNGVSYAHAQGLMPLDLQPKNLIIAEDQTPMLMGIGMVGLTTKNHEVQSVTPYTAPHLKPRENATPSAQN